MQILTIMTNILDGPVFFLTPQDTIGSPGDRISLVCEVDSNPPPSYIWVKDSNIKEVCYCLILIQDNN